MNSENPDRKNAIVVIAKFVLLMVFILGIPFYLYFYQYELIMSFRSLDDAKDFLLQYEVASIFVYLGLQVFHIAAAIIPGQPFHIASGFVYGFWIGYALSISGVTIGSVLTFYLSRVLGKDAMYLFFGEQKFSKFLNLMNSKKGLFIIFLFYLIPGFPKEGLGYAVGLSKIKLWTFLLIMIVGRTPALMGSIAFGSMLDHDSYAGMVILALVAVILCVLALVYRKSIMHWIESKNN